MRAFLVISLLLADAVSLRLAVQAQGLAPTLAWLLAAFVAGLVFIRRQGLRTVGALRAAVLVNDWPGTALWEGLLSLIAGLLLMAPGAASDLVALCLLLPGLRRRLARKLGADRAREGTAPVVLEGEFRERPATPLEAARPAADAPPRAPPAERDRPD